MMPIIETVVKERNSAIELYRVILMFLICLHHAAYHGLWDHTSMLDSTCPIVYILFTGLILWHVDGFLAITGWFGISFKISKFIRLWGIMAAYSLMSIVYGLIVNGHFSWLDLAGGWFGRTYLVFLFITPLLNAAVESLVVDRRKMLIVWSVFDAGLFLTWFPYHNMINIAAQGTEAFSIMTFVAVYVNVRFLRLSGLHDVFSKKIITLVVLAIEFGVALVAFARTFVNVAAMHSTWNWYVLANNFTWLGSYNSPHLMLVGIALLLLFAKYVNLPPMAAKFIAGLSPLMFGVYICHDTTSFGHLLFQMPQKWVMSRFDLHPVVIIFLSCVICFIVCCAVEKMRKIITAPIYSLVEPYIRSLDKELIGYVEMKCQERQ